MMGMSSRNQQRINYRGNIGFISHLTGLTGIFVHPFHLLVEAKIKLYLRIIEFVHTAWPSFFTTTCRTLTPFSSMITLKFSWTFLWTHDQKWCFCINCWMTLFLKFDENLFTKRNLLFEVFWKVWEYDDNYQVLWKFLHSFFLERQKDSHV